MLLEFIGGGGVAVLHRHLVSSVCVSVQLLSRCSSFLPQPTDLHIKADWPLSVVHVRECGWLFAM